MLKKISQPEILSSLSTSQNGWLFSLWQRLVGNDNTVNTDKLVTSSLTADTAILKTELTVPTATVTTLNTTTTKASGQTFRKVVSVVSSGSVISYAVTSTDTVILVDVTGGNLDLTLPAANSGGSGFSVTITVCRIDASANVLTILPTGADLVDGAASVAIAASSSSIYESDGVTNWYTTGVK